MAFLLAMPAAAQPTLVVAPLERVQTRQSDATTLTEMIRIQIGKSKRYTLVTPEEQHNIDAELQRQLSGGCSEASCITQIGGALGARYMITGKFSRFGRRYVLFLKLIDIELGKAINTASIQANALEMILDDLERDLPALIGERRSDEPPARLTPLGPQVQGSAIRKAMGWVNIMAKPRNTEVFIVSNRHRQRVRIKGLRPQLEQLPPGSYRWRAQVSGYESKEGNFVVKADETTSLNIVLKRPGNLVIKGKPKGSKVEVSGPVKAVQGLPMMIRSAPSGTYSVTVSNPGYRGKSYSVDVQAEKTATINVRLERISAIERRQKRMATAERINQNVSFLYGEMRFVGSNHDQNTNNPMSAFEPTLWFQPEGLPGLHLPAIHVGYTPQSTAQGHPIFVSDQASAGKWRIGYEHYFADDDAFTPFTLFARAALTVDPGFEVGSSFYVLPFLDTDMGATVKISAYAGTSSQLGAYAGMSVGMSWAGALSLAVISIGAIAGG